MIRRAGLSAVFALALAVPAAASPESERLLADFVALIDASPAWTASASLIRSEGENTIGEGLVFALDDPHVAISVERLTLSDLEAGGGGGFTATRIEASGASLVSDVVDYKIPTATVTDVSAPSTAGLGVDPRRLMTSFAKFYAVISELEFGEFSVPSVTAEQRDPTSAPATIVSHITYRDIVSTDMRDGVLASSKAGPIVIRMDAPNAEPIEFSFGGAEAEQIDVGAIARIFDASQYRDGRGDNVWRPILSRARYFGFSGSGPDGATFKLDEVALESIDGRQPEEPFTQLWDRLLDPEVAEETKGDLAIEALTGMYSAWRMGTLRIAGLEVNAPAEDTAFSLGGVTLTGLSSEGIDSFIMKAMAAESPAGFFSLDNFEFAGFLFPDVDALMQFAALESDATPERHDETMRAAFKALPRLGHLAIDNVSGGLSRDLPVTLKGLRLDLKDWNEFFAQATEFRLDELVVPRALMEVDEETAKIVDALGYDAMNFSMGFSDRWRVEDGSDQATWIFSMKDAADVEFTYRIDGVTVDWMLNATAVAARGDDSEAAFMEMLAGLTLTRAEVKVRDHSLLDRGFGVAALMQGLSVEGKAYREQMRNALPFLLSAAIPAELAKLVVKPLQSFLGGNQAIVVNIDPPQPLHVTDLISAAGMEPQAIAEMLGVTVTTEDLPGKQ
jgi:hypothetical protein